jgi:hypothetical protein
MTDQAVQPWNILGPDATAAEAAPLADDTWDLPGGFASVYYANSDNHGLTRPVIFSDGFNEGPSNPDEMYAHMESGEGNFALVSALKERGSDLIMLGYDERSASILEDAETAIACIRKAADEAPEGAELAVGGFSMGGIITRYALAKMERDGQPHRTSVYFSWDSPHNGAWIPISLQALAHFIKDEDGVTELSDYVNSPAARQLLWRHIETVTGTPAEDPTRTTFLSALSDVGNWPSEPLLLGLANGSGYGTGLGISPGVKTLEVNGLLHPYRTTTLYAQAAGDNKLVANLKRQLSGNPAVEVKTSGLPELDSAPGGTLESFGIAAKSLRKFGAVKCDHEWVDFVPTVSAVAIRELDRQEDLYAPIPASPSTESKLNEFKVSSENTEHSLVTPELAEWLLERLPK